MGRRQLETSIVIRAPIEDVFDRLIDHEAMASWPGVGSCKLIEEGSPRNGLGAVRRIRVRGITLDERVVRYERPTAFDYAILRGLPIDHHLGEVRLREVEGGRVEVTWTIEISSRWPLVAEIVASQLRSGLPRALRFVADGLER
jgi:uncharacterized protein YndB with AHSA1/START domain